jgi:hypothetical protein
MATMRPRVVEARISPYPVVVMVVTDQYNAAEYCVAERTAGSCKAALAPSTRAVTKGAPEYTHPSKW